MKKFKSIFAVALFSTAILMTTFAFSQSNLPAVVQKKDIPQDIPENIRENVLKLYSLNPKERGNAAFMLSKMGKKASAAVPYLIESLEDQNILVKLNILGALGKIGDRRAIKPLIKVFVNTAELGTEINPVFMALNNIDSLWSKSDEAKESVPELIKVMNDSDSMFRGKAAFLLGKIKDPKSVKPLMALLKDENPYIQELAAKTLGEIGDNRAVEPLVSALESNNHYAAEALGSIRDIRAVEHLVASLKSDDKNMKEAAVKALGNFGDSFYIEPLIALLKDESRHIRSSTVLSLDKMNWQPRNDVDRINYLVAKQKWNDLIKEGKFAVIPIISILKNSDYGDVINAVKALDKIDPDWRNSPDAKEIVSEMIISIKDENVNDRYGKAVALGQIGDKQAVDSLIIALDDMDSNVQKGVAGILDGLDPDWRKRGSVDNVIKELIADLQSRHLVERSILALGLIRSTVAVEPLISLMKDESILVRGYAAEALGQIGDSRAVEPLIAALKENDSEVRWRAASALGDIRDKRAIEQLIRALFDDNYNVREKAFSALEKIDTQWHKNEAAILAIPEFIDALNNWHWNVQSDAHTVLKRITGKDFDKEYEKWIKWWDEYNAEQKKD